MISTNSPTSDWSECPSGALQQLPAAIRRGRRIRAVKRIGKVGGGAGLAAVAVWLGVQAFLPGGIGNARDLACSDVDAAAAAYVAGTVDETTRKQIDAHLTHCDLCSQMIEQMRIRSRPETALLPSEVCPLCGKRHVAMEAGPRLSMLFSTDAVR